MDRVHHGLAFGLVIRWAYRSEVERMLAHSTGGPRYTRSTRGYSWRTLRVQGNAECGMAEVVGENFDAKCRLFPSRLWWRVWILLLLRDL